MASVLSYRTAFPYYSSNPYDRLTQSLPTPHRFYLQVSLPDSRLTVELIHLPIATCVTSDIRHAHHLFMGPWLMTPA
jgi:hypothetical protein